MAIGFGKMRKIAVFAPFALAIGLWAAAPALAQALAPQYQSSQPDDGQILTTAPESVQVTFSEPLDDSSNLSVLNECGEKADAGNPTVELNKITVSMGAHPYEGSYRVLYTAHGVGKVTGTTNGEFGFSVLNGHPCEDEHKGHEDCEENPDQAKCKKHGGHEDCEENPDQAKCDGHGRHNDDDDHKNGHNDGNHDDGNHDVTGHTTDHDTMDHSATGSGHAPGHDGGAAGHMGHKAMKGKRNHDQHHGGSGSADGRPLAGGLFSEVPPTATTVALALTLCAGLGIVGGMVLRASPRS